MSEHQKGGGRSLSRRDFLKLGGLLPGGLVTPSLTRALTTARTAPPGSQNVIIVVFDAFSAYNISFYGYARDTMPNLARLADRAVVYHNHFAGSNFTTSGTASLLTGTVPWTHRALQPNHRVAPQFVSKNVFTAFDDYYRLAYTHNGWAFTLLRQFQRRMDDLIPRTRLFLGSYDTFIENMFQNDEDIATVSWTRDMKIADEGYAYSLFMSRLYQVLQEGKVANLERLFPRGIPTTGSDNGFLLEQAVDWLGDLVTKVPQPFFAYFHFLPPHFPYRTSIEFYNRFKGDGYKPVQKPRDVFAQSRVTDNLLHHRTEYDEFALYVDKEFGRFYDGLEASGLLENTWVVFTSDHGEMFERGIMGHSTDVLYQPVIRIPMLILEPGRQERVDVTANTSAVDVLPTLAHVTGHAMPGWTEGVVMPPYTDSSLDPNRGIYIVRAHDNPANEPLRQASVSLVQGRYKLVHYFGYQTDGIQDFMQLYDIEADPEELTNLALSHKDVAQEMFAQLKTDLAAANKPFLP
jgi:arylsulfatase A-like enzyme